MKATFLKSSNFWTAVALAIGGLYIGFNPELATDLVTKVFGLLGTVKLLREYFANKPEIDAGQAVNNSNWWNYIAVVVTSFVPALPGEFFDSIQDVMTNLVNGNWQASLVGLFSIATILYNLFKSKEKVPGAELNAKATNNA